MAENIDINVNANTSTAQRNLDALNSKITGLSASWTKFVGVLASFGAINIAARAIQYADAIQDLSEATGVATEKILAFQSAVELAGGSTEKAQQGLSKFVSAIGEAASGSGSLQYAFARVGVTLNDLRTLSEQDLLRKTVTGLANIEDKATRAAVQTDLFGKALRGTDMAGVAANLDKGAEAAKKYADAIKRASDIQDAIDRTFQTFKLSVLELIAPLGNLAKTVSESQDAIKKFFDVLVTGVAWAIIAAGVLLVGKAIAALVLIARGAIAVMTTLGLSFTGLLRALATPLTRSNIIANLEMLPGLGPKLTAFFNATGVSVAWLTNNLGKLALAAGFSFGALKEFFGFSKTPIKDPIADFASSANELDQSYAALGNKVREVNDALAKQRNELQKISKEFANQNYLNDVAIQNETQYVKIGQDYAEVLRAQREIYDRHIKVIEDLTERKKNLKDEEKALIPVIDEQIAKIKEQAVFDTERIKRSIEGLQSARAVEEDRKRTIENTTKAIEDQTNRYRVLGDITRGAADQLKEAQFQQAQQGRSPLEQQYANIAENLRRTTLEAQRSFAAQYDGMDLTIAQSTELSNGLERIAEEYKKIGEVQTQSLDISRTWAAGWKTAFDQYMENATNAATRAGETFNSIMGNMNRAIDDFVKTGKFNFKEFARSVIQDLLAIELKAQAATLFRGLFSAGGSFLGSLFGFAKGGTPPVNKPSIVGEQGPELFVPKTPGTIVPNNALAGAATGAVNAPITNNYITNNISALDAKSVAKLFIENRKTLLGSVNMARKELPYGV